MKFLIILLQSVNQCDGSRSSQANRTTRSRQLLWSVNRAVWVDKVVTAKEMIMLYLIEMQELLYGVQFKCRCHWLLLITGVCHLECHGNANGGSNSIDTWPTLYFPSWARETESVRTSSKSFEGGNGSQQNDLFFHWFSLIWLVTVECSIGPPNRGWQGGPILEIKFSCVVTYA